jgi:hypothetical protein
MATDASGRTSNSKITVTKYMRLSLIILSQVGAGRLPGHYDAFGDILAKPGFAKREV